MANHIELGQQLEAARADLKAKWDAFPMKKLADGSEAKDIPGNEIENVRKMHEDVNEIGKSYHAAKEIHDLAQANDAELKTLRTVDDRKPVGGEGERKAERKSLFQELKDSDQFKSRTRYMDEFEAKEFGPAEFKTLMTTGADGYPPQVLRDPGVVPIASRPPQLIDFLRIEPTTQTGISFMKQSVRTNNAAAKSEGSALDEAVITYAATTDIISRIGTSIPVTEENLEDVSELETLVNNDLILMVRQELDRQVTVGDGNAPNLRGIYNATSIQSQARGADPAFDAWLKAITKITVTGRANANLCVMHGTDWQFIALSRTSDGLYILGNPQNMPQKMLWGLPVALSEALTATNGLALDTSYFPVKMRKGVTIAVTDSHASEFTSNITRIRVHVRAGIKRMRDEAACKVTGLPS